MNNRNPQLNKNGELQHLLTTEGLPAAILVKILDTAESFVGVTERDVKKIPLLRGKSVFNLFFEPSTRTRTTFDIAANDCQLIFLIWISLHPPRPKARPC